MTLENEKSQQEILTIAHENFQKDLNARAFFKLHDHSLGEDLVQSTFLKTWSYIVRGGEIQIMKAFLYHILNGLIIDEYRKKRNTSLDIMMEKGFEPSEAPSEGLINFLDGKKAMLLIARLPAKYQKIMRMRYIQDLTLAEMSLITGQSKNTIAVQTHRGLQKLKKLYQPYMGNA